MLSVAVVSTRFVVWILRSLMVYGVCAWLGRRLSLSPFSRSCVHVRFVRFVVVLPFCASHSRFSRWSLSLVHVLNMYVLGFF